MYLPASHSSFKMTPEMEIDSTMSRTDDIVKDAFELDNSLKMFLSENRIPVIADLRLVIIYVVFLTLLLMVIIIIPGVRKTKITSFLAFATLLVGGATILLSIQDSNWFEASSKLNNAPFSVLSTRNFNGTLRLQVGLFSANVTLEGEIFDKYKKNDSIEYVDFNERFYWLEPEGAKVEHINALLRGLPNPILTVSEFLSQDSEGFNWSRRLRTAGYYTSITLYSAEITWLMTLVLMCCIPEYMPLIIQVTGMLMMLAAFIYSTLVSLSGQFEFFVNGKHVELVFGATFLRILIVGTLVLISGKTLEIISSLNPLKELTIMDYEAYRKDRVACTPSYK